MQKNLQVGFTALLCTLPLSWTETAAAATSDDDVEDPKPKMLELSGEIDLSYTSIRADSGNEHIRQAYGEINAVVSPHERLSFHTTVEKSQYGKAKLSEAYLEGQVLADESLTVSTGKKDLPFGSFESNMVSYSLPKDLGFSSGKTTLETAYQRDNITVKSYIFKGTSPKTGGTGKHGRGYGVGIEHDTDNTNVGIDYLSNLAESDWFEPNDVARKVPAVAVHGQIERGRVKVVAEHLQAIKSFLPDDLDEEISETVKPSATQLEVDIDLGNDRTLAIAHNQTRNAEELGFSKKVQGVTYSQPLYKKLSGAVELSRFKDYDGEKGKVLNVELSIDF